MDVVGLLVCLQKTAIGKEVGLDRLRSVVDQVNAA
jgi:hypothetical protein